MSFDVNKVTDSSGASASSMGELGYRPLATQTGPFNHMTELISCLAVDPLDKTSAGLSLPGQWCQQPGGIRVCISEALLATKGFDLLGLSFIQDNATVLSVQQWEGVDLGSFKAFLAKISNLFVSKRAINSNLGKVTVLNSATLALDIASDTSSPHLTYTTEPYPASEASPNPWSSTHSDEDHP